MNNEITIKDMKRTIINMFKKLEEKITIMVREVKDMKKIQTELPENFLKKFFKEIHRMGLTAH